MGAAAAWLLAKQGSFKAGAPRDFVAATRAAVRSRPLTARRGLFDDGKKAEGGAAAPGAGGMPNLDMGKLAGMMPKMMESMKKLPELQNQLKEMPVEGTAMDGLVKVTVSGGLEPKDVYIADELLTTVSASEISRAVLAAMKEAKAVSMSQEKLKAFYEDLGVEMPAGGAAPGGAP